VVELLINVPMQAPGVPHSKICVEVAVDLQYPSLIFSVVAVEPATKLSVPDGHAMHFWLVAE
jgi:hypothetical protein